MAFFASERWRICASLVMVELVFAGFQVITKSAISTLSINALCVLAMYRNAIATAFIFPFAYFLDRSKRPKLSFTNLFHFFMSALIGISMNQILFLLGIYYTSAAFTSTMQNLIPSFTFILAAALRAEQIGFKNLNHQAKVLGTVISFCGAMTVSCYTGSPLMSHKSFTTKATPVIHGIRSEASAHKSTKLGILFLVGNCATWAAWLAMQGPIMRSYPAQLSATAFTLGFGSIQLLTISALPLAAGAHVSWKIESYSYLMDILYGGIIASGVGTTMMSWCARKGGPLLVGAYQPLQTLITILLSIVFHADTLYTGSVVGGSLILVGLYLVLWGKSKEGDGDEHASECLKCDVERATLNERLILDPR